MAIKNPLKLCLNFVALFGFIAAMIYLSVRYSPLVVDLFSQREELKSFIEAQGVLGVLIFILFQIFQVVVAAVPGEFVQIAGGFLFGTVSGTLYLVIGVVIGSVIAFYAARLLGCRLVSLLISRPKLESLEQLINGPKSEVIMLLLFVIPGMPKDLLTYIAGLTPVRPWRFLCIAVIGRLPALAISCYIGANLQQENFILALSLFALAALLFLAGVIFKHKIFALIRKC